MATFLTKTATGLLQRVAAIAASAGIADAGKIIETDSNGLIDASFLPATTSQSVTANAAVALTAGDFVYIDATGEVDLADNASASTAAIGYVSAGATIGSPVGVFLDGFNSNVTVLVGNNYFLGSNGAITNTPPNTIGAICQRLGQAVTTSSLAVEIDQPIENAVQ